MLIRIGYRLGFSVPAPTPMLLMLYAHPSVAHRLHRPDRLHVEPDVPVEDFIDPFGNRVARVVAPAGNVTFWGDTVIEDSGEPDEVNWNAVQHPVEELPPHVLPFLFASRYCEVDLMSDVAWNLFGNTPQGWARVQAVVNWVYNHVQFGYQFARSTKTAKDVYEEKAGVCRDFQHLSITLLRALNIPARYATGYLGDIGVPANPAPMDFSAWFEVYLSGRWWAFDGRHNTPRIGRILQAAGRDATDVALTTSFGPT